MKNTLAYWGTELFTAVKVLQNRPRKKALGSLEVFLQPQLIVNCRILKYFVNFSHFQQSQIFVGKAGWNLSKWEYIEVLQSNGMLLNIRLGCKLLTVIHALAYCDSELFKPLKKSVVKVPDGFRKFRNFITFFKMKKKWNQIFKYFPISSMT